MVHAKNYHKDLFHVLLDKYFAVSECEGEDRERLIYHIQTGDYFALVATILGFLEDSIQKNYDGGTPVNPKEIQLMKKLRSDLVHLHSRYDIVPKQTVKVPVGR